MPPVVSVITPVYNRLHLLRRALDTIFAQEGLGDLFDLDVIVVDDASDRVSADDVRGIIGSSPVRYTRHAANRGLSGARNTGIRFARGEYVAFLDDDDEFLPHKLRTQLPVLIADPDVALVYGPCIGRAPDGTEEIWPGGPSGWIFRDLLKRNVFQVASVLTRRAVLEQRGGFDEALRTVEDYELWLWVAYHFRVACVEKPVSVYCHSAGKFVRDVADGTALRCFLGIARNIASYAPDEAGFAKQELLAKWISILRMVLPERTALPVVQQTLLADPTLAGIAPVAKALSLLIRENALGDASPIGFTARAAESIPRPLRGMIWMDLSLSLLKRRRIGSALRAAARALNSDPGQTIQTVLARTMSVLRSSMGRSPD